MAYCKGSVSIGYNKNYHYHHHYCSRCTGIQTIHFMNQAPRTPGNKGDSPWETGAWTGESDLSGLEGPYPPTATCQAFGTLQVRGVSSHPKLAGLYLVMIAAGPEALPESLEKKGEKKGRGGPKGLCLRLPGQPLQGLHTPWCSKHGDRLALVSQAPHHLLLLLHSSRS